MRCRGRDTVNSSVLMRLMWDRCGGKVRMGRNPGEQKNGGKHGIQRMPKKTWIHFTFWNNTNIFFSWLKINIHHNYKHSCLYKGIHTEELVQWIPYFGPNFSLKQNLHTSFNNQNLIINLFRNFFQKRAAQRPHKLMGHNASFIHIVKVSRALLSL